MGTAFHFPGLCVWWNCCAGVMCVAVLCAAHLELLLMLCWGLLLSLGGMMVMDTACCACWDAEG